MSDLIVELEGIIPTKVIVNVKDKLRIGKDLEKELDGAAEQFGFFAVLAEKAVTRHDTLTLAYKLWRAEAETKVNEEHKLGDVKLPTKDQMVSIIRSDLKYKATQLKLIKYSEDIRILKALASAFEKKVETIRTKCSNKRRESSS